MKLMRLELHDDYRSLKSGFKLRFTDGIPKFDDGIIRFDDGISTFADTFNAYCLVGQNGSGKSNILELLSGIFYQLEVMSLDYLPQVKIENENEDGEEEFEDHKAFGDFDVKPNAYVLEYHIKNKEIRVEKKKGDTPAFYIKTKESLESLNVLQMKEYLPEYIVGYSSGENEILSLPFLKMRMIQYDEYLEYLHKDIAYNSAESRMVYLDDIYSQAIFVTNFLDVDNNLKEDGLLDIFSDTLGISAIEEFRMLINTDIEIPNPYTELDESVIAGVQSKIEVLKRCSTMYYEDIENDKLYLDFHLDDTCKEAFRRNFDTGRELFEFFQVLITLNYYQTKQATKDKLYKSKSLYAKGFLPQLPWDDKFFTFKDFWIQKEGSEKPILSRSLSDGEHQFMHTIGIALLYRGTSSLFLLDEPETHFNPAWRAKYISTLRKCFKGDIVSPEVMITSHSPFIVSDSKPENVLVFDKDKNNVVKCTRPSFNTFGASVNKITMEVFGKIDTIGDFANSRFEIFRERFDKGEDVDLIIKEVDRTFGDSMEKILFIKKLLNKKVNK